MSALCKGCGSCHNCVPEGPRFPHTERPAEQEFDRDLARVHNHRPYNPPCNERLAGGQLRGACLNDDGSPRMNHPIEQEFAVVVAALLAGRIDGQQAVASLTALHERILSAAIARGVAR